MDANRKKDITKISIIIPTYNEQDNIGLLLEGIHESMKEQDYEVIIVDDNSPDGTANTVERLNKRYPAKVVIRKNARGLATAVVEGFRHAKGEILVVMDADLQHPPEAIKSLLNEIIMGADIAIGSRYVKSDGFSNFSIYRKIISKGATLIARILFRNLSGIQDLQSGFFALKKRVIENTDLKPIGYKILLEILAVGHYTTVKEIPYTFSERKNGQTKMNSMIMLEYILHTLILFQKSGEPNRFAKYCSVGATGIAVNTIILFVFTNVFGVFYLLSSVLAHEVSIISNFIINNNWTFKGAKVSNDKSSIFKRAIKYNFLKVGGVMLSIVFLFIFTELLSINYILSNIMAIVMGVAWGYSTSVTLVWRSS